MPQNDIDAEKTGSRIDAEKPEKSLTSWPSHSVTHTDENLVRIYEAVSNVFPEEPNLNGLKTQEEIRKFLCESRLRKPLDTPGVPTAQTDPDGTRRRAIELIEAELSLLRKQQLARMALTQDWSGLPSYLREGIMIWRDRISSRAEDLLFRFGLLPSPGSPDLTSLLEPNQPIISAPVVIAPESAFNVDLRLNLQRLGMAVVSETSRSVIKTGSVALDHALQSGGFPRGRIIEIFGKEGAGKTTLALASAANAQHNGEAVAYIDAEHKLDLSWARTQGLDLQRALILRGATARPTLESVLEVIRSARFALVAIDTLAALVPGEAVETSHGDYVGEMGQLFARTLPRIASAASKTNTCVLLLNQIRHNHEEVFGRAKVSPGGHALAHYSSIKLELSRVTPEKRGNEVIGSRVKGTVIKSCVGSPWRSAEWSISFERGIHDEYDLEQGRLILQAAS